MPAIDFDNTGQSNIVLNGDGSVSILTENGEVYRFDNTLDLNDLGLTDVGPLGLSSTGSSSPSQGAIEFDGTDIYAGTGGGTKNLSDIGSGTSGTSDLYYGQPKTTYGTDTSGGILIHRFEDIPGGAFQVRRVKFDVIGSGSLNSDIQLTIQESTVSSNGITLDGNEERMSDADRLTLPSDTRMDVLVDNSTSSAQDVIIEIYYRIV